jgi:hypothetical protein
MRSITSRPAAIWNWLRVPIIIAGALAVMVAVARWGGITRSGPLFVAGVALLSGLVLAFGMLAWWLYFSQLPAEAAAAPPRSTAARQVLGMLSLISGALFLIGSFWDEVWHRTYGSFGDDFLWPPHMLIYGSLALVALFAGGGLLLMMLGGGNLRQRFRAEPHIGMLALVSAFLVASIPSDLLWHSIYGIDLTAWGLPHLMLASGVALVLLATVALQLSLVPLAPWRGLRGLAAAELLALLGCAGATTMLLQFGTADWEGLTAIGDIGLNPPIFWQRPEWLYPVVIAVIALFCGNLAIHALHRAGAATAVALVALAFRLALLVGAGAMRPGVGMGFVPQLAIVPPLLLLDLWYMAQLRRRTGQELRTENREPEQRIYNTEQTRMDRAAAGYGLQPTDRSRNIQQAIDFSILKPQFPTRDIAVGNLLAGVLFLATGLPLIARVQIYPRINLTTLPGMISWSLVAALAFGWAGARLGAWFGALDRPAQTPRNSAWAGRMAAAALLAAVLFTAFFILTAQPPIAA